MRRNGLDLLVSPSWLAANTRDANIRVIEIAGLGQEEMTAYKAGHIPGAACWQWKEMLWDERRRDFPAPEEFARRLGAAGIGNDTTVVLYGEPFQFGVYAWWALRYCGHRDVRLLDGGRTRWSAEGRALETATAAPPAPLRYRPVERAETMRILRDDLLAELGEPGLVVVDARSGEEYRGERVGAPGMPDTGAVRYGRIPGARHLYFDDLLGADKSFKTVPLLESEIARVGLQPADRIVAYCRMSHRATVVYFALTQLLGFENVRLYDGSWTEWGNLVGVPVER